MNASPGMAYQPNRTNRSEELTELYAAENRKLLSNLGMENYYQN